MDKEGVSLGKREKYGRSSSANGARNTEKDRNSVRLGNVAVKAIINGIHRGGIR